MIQTKSDSNTKTQTAMPENVPLGHVHPRKTQIIRAV